MTAPRIAKTFPLFLCILLLLSQQNSRALPLATDALRFFNNFFVTGDYVVGGVGLWGTGHGTIHMGTPAPPMSAAPEGAEALAAFLYWQVVTSANPTAVDVNAGATFNGLPLDTPLGTQLLPTTQGVAVGTQACQLNGGASKRVHTFRSDVLRFLDVDPATGRRVINKVDGYPVALSNNGTTRTLGASLVVIYRNPDPLTPLNAIVVDDGTFVKQQFATLHQKIEGFYDPKSVPGQITYIAGSAQSNLGERLTGGAFAPQNNLFDGASGNAWDNVTVATNALDAGTTSFDTAIAPQTSGPLGFLVNDCIAMGAMIYRTEVNDSDGDGLLDKWETESGLVAPNGEALPNLADMGASSTHRDIFIEVGAMTVEGITRYGSSAAPFKSTPPVLEYVEDPIGHNHMPTPAALQMVGDAFQSAPADARYPSAGAGIAVHFDVGDPAVYKTLVAYPGQALGDSPYNSSVADNYIIGAGGSSGNVPTLALGGESVLETRCLGPCQFPDYPGTVSWKTGYEELLFDHNRKDSFHYAFYGHAKGIHKSPFTCLDGAGLPTGLDEMGNCAESDNPDFHVPRGVSGSGDYPGGDFLVTLGFFDNTKFVGSDFAVASTTMHELGHNLDLGHGGDALPNCKPNYLSVMSYLFQLGGLVDADGVPHLGYSGADNDDVVESGVRENYSLPGPYRTSWYAPKLPGDTRTTAKRFCNGQIFDPASPPGDWVRVDGSFDPMTGSPIAIDWNANGAVDGTYPQDVNFDGDPTTTLTGFDDWAALRLNQIGSRRGFGAFSLGSNLLADGSQLRADGSVLLADGSQLLADGSVSLANGSQLLADGSVLLADGSQLLADGSVLLADGSMLLADGAVLLADGSKLLGNGVLFLADGSVLLADGVTFLADGSVLLADGSQLLADGAVLLADGSPLLADGVRLFAWDFEPTPKVAAETGNTPGPNSLTACVIGGTGESACSPGPPSNPPSEPLHRVWLDWEAPNTGDVDHYLVYRVEGDTITSASVVEQTTVPGAQTFLLDETELPDGIQFTYVVQAVLADDDETVTPRSNEKTITAENTKPLADSQGVTVWEDWPSDPPVITLTGQDPDSAGLAFNVVAGPMHGSLTGTSPNLTYLSALNYNGSDSFTFKVKETSTWIAPVDGVDRNQESDPPPATVSITVTPVNDKPSFTKGPNQTVTQPTVAQTVLNWATAFSPGPPDESSQNVLAYHVVSNTNSALFSAGPVVDKNLTDNNGTLKYTPAAGLTGCPCSATIGVTVQDTGGTAEGHGAVDTSDSQTFTITVNPVPATPISFVRTDTWLTTSTSNRKFDLKAQVLRNGTVVAEKEITGIVVGLGSSFSKAVYKQIQPLIPSTSSGFTAADTLRVKLWVKLSTNSAGGNQASAEIRLWYNTPGNNSHLHAIRAGTEVKYYMVTGFLLQKNPAQAAGGTQYVSVNVKQGEAYKVLGTWSITGP